MNEKDKKRLGELLALLADGDTSVLGELSELIEKVLKTIGNTYYRNRADVEDAVSNLYVKLYDKAKKFRNNKNAYAWIIRVFENNIKSDLRSLKLEKEYWKEKEAQLSFTSEIDEKYIENHLFLREIFSKLTNEEKRLIVYYYWCKCTVREMAWLMRIPKSTIDRKLKKLEEKIKNF